MNDTGDSLVNMDNAFAVAMQTAQDGTMVVVAFGPGVNTVLTAGSEERCRQALDAVRKAAKERWAVLDLRDILGQRPNLTVARIALPEDGRQVKG